MSLKLSLEILLNPKEVGTFFKNLSESSNITKTIMEYYSSSEIVKDILIQMTKNIANCNSILNNIDSYNFVISKDLKEYVNIYPQYGFFIISEIILIKNTALLDLIKRLLYPFFLYSVAIFIQILFNRRLLYICVAILIIFIIVFIYTVRKQTLFIREMILFLKDMELSNIEYNSEIRILVQNANSIEQAKQIFSELLTKSLQKIKNTSRIIRFCFHYISIIIVFYTLYITVNEMYSNIINIIR